MEKIHITMFGEFTVSYKGKTFTERDCKGSKSLQLIQYLIAQRDRYIAQSTLIDLLWQDSDNPVNALKTLVHRTRSIINDFFGENIELILSQHGTYSFNKELDIEIDSGEFSSLCTMGDDEQLPPLKRVQIYRRAMQLYKGSYLSNFAEENWVRPINVYFHSLYISLAEKCAKILYPLGRFTNIVVVCEQAMIQSPYNENIHAHLIRALVALGEYTLAENQYRYVKQLLLEQFGTQPSPHLTELYELTVKPRSDTGRSLSIVLGELWEGGVINGGYFCEYEVFRYIFRLYAREARREKRKISVLLLTLLDENEHELKDEKLVAKAMQKLSETISSSMRMRDVFTRYSRCQYLVLLPSADESAAKAVAKRMRDKFGRFSAKNKIYTKITARELSSEKNIY